MYHIKEVKIGDFWGKYNLQTTLKPDVNIFIGKNGTGKTTFINILESVLTLDISLMDNLPFKEVQLSLSSKGKNKKITVKRVIDNESPYEMVIYKIGRNVYDFPIYRQTEYQHRRVHPRHQEMYNQIQAELNEIINISWLSVHRELLEESSGEDYRRRKSYGKNPVDRRVARLIELLTGYRLKIEATASRRSDQFQRDVLISMLFDSQFDYFDFDEYLGLKIKEEKEELKIAYKELGVPQDDAKKRIDRHFKEIKKSITKVKNWKNKKGKLGIEDFYSLPLIKRSQHVIQLSREAEKDKNKIYKPIQNFLDILHDYIPDKKFSLRADGRLQVQLKKMTNDNIDIESLSSGEKQLLIFLTETLLQEDKPYIYLADEPELSMHIEWQEKLIPSIAELNKNSQIIFATHSPEIASGYPENSIDMEDIMNE